MSETLNKYNWVQDFGGLKLFEQWAKEVFDHTLLVALDDPQLSELRRLSQVANIKYVEAVGCEKFAEMCFDKMSELLGDSNVQLKSVEVFEHNANSAIYEASKDDKLS